jgi:(p)ppGpp synthase/HD superfamily hydrolase
MANLERAIEIAVLAHKKALDKSGAPYILHPLRFDSLLLIVDVEIYFCYQASRNLKQGVRQLWSPSVPSQ